MFNFLLDLGVFTQILELNCHLGRHNTSLSQVISSEYQGIVAYITRDPATELSEQFYQTPGNYQK